MLSGSEAHAHRIKESVQARTCERAGLFMMSSIEKRAALSLACRFCMQRSRSCRKACSSSCEKRWSSGDAADANGGCTGVLGEDVGPADEAGVAGVAFMGDAVDCGDDVAGGGRDVLTRSGCALVVRRSSLAACTRVSIRDEVHVNKILRS